MNTTQTTRTAWLLGLTGLIPFVLPALMSWAGKPAWLPAQHAYGACILAFLGAIHWGPALNGSAQRPALLLGWGVVPSLMAWIAIQQAPNLQAVVLAGGLAATFAADVFLNQYHRWPAYYLKLRAVLTAIACASLVLAKF